MRKTTKIILITIIIATILLGIGYAAVQNITLNISGTAAADPTQSNFKVMFTGTPFVSDNTLATASIINDTNASIEVTGLSQKNDNVSVTYTIENASTDLSANLSISTTNSNDDYFSITSILEKTSLIAGETTEVTVTIELIKTPITSIESEIEILLDAIPVQPGEEGNSSEPSQTPDLNVNEYGFYFEQPYLQYSGDHSFIFYEDGSYELYKDNRLLYAFPENSLIYDKNIITSSDNPNDYIIPSLDSIRITGFLGFLENLFYLDNDYEKVPDEAAYIVLLESEERALSKIFPKKATESDIYIYDGYMYSGIPDGWNVILFEEQDKQSLESSFNIITPPFITRNQTSYSKIQEEIAGMPVTALLSTFANCQQMIEAPKIPSTVTNLTDTFSGCTALNDNITIPENVQYLIRTFNNCINLPGSTITINSSELINYSDCFKNVLMTTITLNGNTPTEILNLIRATGIE